MPRLRDTNPVTQLPLETESAALGSAPLLRYSILPSFLFLPRPLPAKRPNERASQSLTLFEFRNAARARRPRPRPQKCIIGLVKLVRRAGALLRQLRSLNKLKNCSAEDFPGPRGWFRASVIWRKNSSRPGFRGRRLI